MSLSFDDELEQINEFKLKKKEIINPDVKNDLKIIPKFLTNEERMNIYKEEVKKTEKIEKEREKKCKENKQIYISSKYNRNKYAYLSGKNKIK